MELFRLYTVHHRRDAFLDLESKYFCPIQVGAAGADLDLGVARDDTVQPNLSAKNRHYSELTAVYWMARQQLPEYVGLMHYRRVFLAPDSLITLRANLAYALAWAGCQIGVRKHLDETLTRKKIVDRQTIEREFIGLISFLNRHIREAEIILPMRGRFVKTNARALYDRSHHLKDYDLFYEILLQKFPEMRPSVEKRTRFRHNYLFNVFIFKQDIFLDYAEKMFAVFSEMEEIIDLSTYTDPVFRVFGALAERFMAVFADHVIRTRGARLMELPVARLIEPPAGTALR